MATRSEVLFFLERNRLGCLGVGYVDLHLLASVALVPAARLWTLDRRLQVVADDLCSAYEGVH